MVAMVLLGSCSPAKSTSSVKELVLDRDFPDPSVLKAADGFYYAYGTQTPEGTSGMINLQVARSKDLAKWEYLGEGLPTKPTWASRTQNIWAPHVSYYQGKYILYYSADPNTQTGLCLAVATSLSPRGPFVDNGEPLLCGRSFVNIDPMQFEDPKTGSAYLIWGSGFEPLKIQKLAEDRTHFSEGSTPTDIIWPIPDSRPDNYQNLVEGSWMLEKDGWYYLFFSGDNCCDLKPHYGVMVARSRSVTGPFENFSDGLGLHKNVVVAEDETWSAPGHNAVVKDEKGEYWIFYHGIRRKDPYLRGSQNAVRRPLLRSRIKFENEWPRLVK